MRILFSILLAIICLDVCADNGPELVPILQDPVEIQFDGTTLHGVHFLNESGRANTGKWIIFAHGFTLNWHEFEFLIPELMKAGFDCWAFNFRGHGNGADRSTVISYQEGDYSVEKMVTDFAGLVTFVQAQHPGAGHVLVHSMGGLVLRAGFARKLLSPAQIESVVMLGSPPHFNQLRSTLRITDIFGVNRVLETALGSGSGQELIPLDGGIGDLTKILNQVHGWNPLYWFGRSLFRSTIGLFSNAEMGSLAGSVQGEEWLQRSLTNGIPKDTFRSFLRYLRDGYSYENAHLPVPVLHIVGEKDYLAPFSVVAASARIQSFHAGHWMMQARGIGHFGVVTPGVIEGFRTNLLKFLQQPEMVGPKNETSIYFHPIDGDAQSPLDPVCEAKLLCRLPRAG